MSMLLAWVVFPAVLVVLATGCGLLLRVVCDWEIPGPIVPGAGLAVIVVITGFTTMSDATAELSVPLVLVLAAAGLGLGIGRWRGEVGPWELLAALAVFLVFAAPVVLSGKATFAGYIKLDDTATWMAFTDRIIEHGRSTAGLAPSTFEATIAVNLPKGYPLGALLPLGVGRALVGQDVAWLVQPYMAAMAAMLALALCAIARSLLPSERTRALVAFVAAQPALFFAYSLWGGIKEVAAALLLAVLAAVVPASLREWSDGRWSAGRLVVVAIAAGALLSVLGVGGAVWVAVILGMAGLLVPRRGPAPLLVPAVALLVLVALFAVPVLVASGTPFSPTQSPLVNGSELGNLIHPLSGLQVIGIWPVGDFRLRPDDIALTYLLLAVAVAVGVIGLVAAGRAKAWTLLLYCTGSLLGCLAIVVVASPWVDAKALTSAAPAALMAACAGAAFLMRTEARIFGSVALLVIGAGVIWSNVLAYHDVNLAPRDQLAELQGFGSEISGQGPTLTTDSEIYGGRHFLRDADPEDSTDLRRRPIPLVGGGAPDSHSNIDPDRLALPGLLVYRTLVLLRSPSNSRPPSPYRLVRRGRYYDVWQRPPKSERSVFKHLGLGRGQQPSAVPSCDTVRDLARIASRRGPGAWLAATAGDPVTLLGPGQTVHPASWVKQGDPQALFLTDSGQLSARFSVSHPSRYRIWLGGSVRGSARASVDRRPLGSIEGQLAGANEYTELGSIALTAGSHRLLLDYDSKPLSPGSGTPAQLPYPSGPIAISSGPDDPGVRYVKPADASKLCGKRWDWLEVVAG